MEGKPEFNAGANKLTNTLHSMIQGITDKPPIIDFGVINSDLSLTINSFPRPVPKSDYSVCRSVLYDPSVPLTETYTDGTHSHPGAGEPGLHFHEVKLPKKMYWLLPGDKVLVAVVQNEFIVIDKVYNAEHLGEGEPAW